MKYNAFLYDNLENGIRKIWSRILHLSEEQISVEDKFFQLGGSSLKAFELLHELELYIGKPIDSELLVACRTIKEITNYIKTHFYDFQENSKQSSNVKLSNELNISKAVAITGMALRLPYAKTKEEFWSNLYTKKNCFSKISEKRKNLSGELDWCDWLAELNDIEYFDNSFFEMSSEESIFIDPQQRLALEVAYEALEDAGIISHINESSNIGVYSAANVNSYYYLVLQYLQKKGIKNVHHHALIGNMPNIIPASIAQVFNFIGPVIAVDTACSSSLTSIYYAVEALRKDQIEGAVIVSTNILANSFLYTLSKKAGIISNHSSPKIFDQRSDGTVLGEGILVFYLEKLSKAIDERKNIYGIIRGIAINNDGTSFGRMAPNPKGQYGVLSKAYQDANLFPTEVSYIETHGTGTTIGDVIEINTLNKLFSQYEKLPVKSKKKGNKVGIGSIKSNIGHLLPAAGAAGLAKVLLCFKHQILVPGLSLIHENPALKLNFSPFYIVKEIQRWHREKGKSLKAGLSSFGFGGTNIHIVLEEWVPSENISLDQSIYLLTLSAKTKTALDEITCQTKKVIKKLSNSDINNLCFTRNRYRKHYDYRSYLILSDKKKVIHQCKKSYIDLNKKNPRIVALLENLNETLDISASNSFLYWYSLFKKLKKNVNNSFEIISLDKEKRITQLSGEGNDECIDSLSLKPDILITINTYTKNKLKSFLKNLPDNLKIINLENKNYHSIFEWIQHLMGELYVLGVDFNWNLIHPNGSGKLISLPSYPFKRKCFWINHTK